MASAWQENLHLCSWQGLHAAILCCWSHRWSSSRHRACQGWSSAEMHPESKARCSEWHRQWDAGCSVLSLHPPSAGRCEVRKEGKCLLPPAPGSSLQGRSRRKQGLLQGSPSGSPTALLPHTSTDNAKNPSSKGHRDSEICSAQLPGL